mgnify:FL=1
MAMILSPIFQQEIVAYTLVFTVVKELQKIRKNRKFNEKFKNITGYVTDYWEIRELIRIENIKLHGYRTHRRTENNSHKRCRRTVIISSTIFNNTVTQ